jgi:hypothetical protein
MLLLSTLKLQRRKQLLLQKLQPQPLNWLLLLSEALHVLMLPMHPLHLH